MSDGDPVPGSTYQVSVEGGTAYYYDGSDAGQAATASMVRALVALEQQQAAKNAALAEVVNDARPKGDDIVVAATVVAAVAGVVGAAAAIGGTAAAVGSLGMSVAGVVQQAEATGDGVFEIIIRNETASPMVCYSFANGGCSTASSVPPIEPGGSASIDIIQKGGFEADAYISLYFMLGGGLIKPEGGSDVIALKPVTARIKYKFDGSDWRPGYSFQGGDQAKLPSGQKGLWVGSFHPDDDQKMLGFAISASLVQKSSGAAEVVFMPEAATFGG